MVYVKRLIVLSCGFFIYFLGFLLLPFFGEKEMVYTSLIIFWAIVILVNFLHTRMYVAIV